MIKKLLILMSTVACLLLFVFVLNNTSATVVNITDQTMQRDTLKVALHDKVYKMSYKQNHDDALTGLEVDLAKTLAKNTISILKCKTWDTYGIEELGILPIEL